MFAVDFPIIEADLLRAKPATTATPAHEEWRFIMGGIPAHNIEEAEHAHFYGVKGSTREAGIARRNITDAVSAFFTGNAIHLYAYEILSAHALDTSGTPTPYLAEIRIWTDC